VTRRKFLRLMAAASAEVGAFALGGAYTIWAEPYWLSVERVTISARGAA